MSTLKKIIHSLAIPVLVAVILVTNSGREVPKAIIVKAIILSLTPRIVAILVAESTTKLLPNIIPVIPTMVKINDLGSDSISFLSSSTLFLDIAIK